MEAVSINAVDVGAGKRESVRVLLDGCGNRGRAIVNVVIGDRVRVGALIGAAADVAKHNRRNRSSCRMLNSVPGDRPPARRIHPNCAQAAVAETVAGDAHADRRVGQVVCIRRLRPVTVVSRPGRDRVFGVLGFAHCRHDYRVVADDPLGETVEIHGRPVAGDEGVPAVAHAAREACRIESDRPLAVDPPRDPGTDIVRADVADAPEEISRDVPTDNAAQHDPVTTDVLERATLDLEVRVQRTEAIEMAPDLVARSAAECTAYDSKPTDRIVARLAVTLSQNTTRP